MIENDAIFKQLHANQLLLTTGMKRFGSPATLKKGRLAVEEYLTKELGISSDQFHIAEGSGISRKNLLTPDAVLLLLKSFIPYQQLLPEKQIPYKTGTLKGVYSMAGYLSTRDPLYFVISQSKKNHREKSEIFSLKQIFQLLILKTTPLISVLMPVKNEASFCELSRISYFKPLQISNLLSLMTVQPIQLQKLKASKGSQNKCD